MTTVQQRAADVIAPHFDVRWRMSHAEEAAAALAAAGLLADPTTSRTDAEQDVIDAANEWADVRRPYRLDDFTLNARGRTTFRLLAAVDRLTATEEATS